MGMGGSPKAQDCLGGVLEDHGGSGRVMILVPRWTRKVDLCGLWGSE